MKHQFANQRWDVIIVGTGIGGATLGYALAKAGKRVIFCEKGKSHIKDHGKLEGDFAEVFFDSPVAPGPAQADILARAGRWKDEIIDRTNSRERRFIPFVGAGTGGSSALYGMVLERFYPEDFNLGSVYPDAGTSSLPQAWPISYEEFSPYYELAEQLYSVRGTRDPMRSEQLSALPPSQPLTEAGSELESFLESQGLHPYRLPMACKFVPGCNGCQGYLCPKHCKNDSATTCLAPAIEDYGASLLDECRALRLEASKKHVSGVVCERHNQIFTLHADIVVLGAGALETPCLLLRSASPDWPNGLANTSDMVGRNLMRHFVDLYAIPTKTRNGLSGNRKELGLNDFYSNRNRKLGTLQSFGALPPAPVIVATLEKDIRDARYWLLPIFKFGKPVIRMLLERIFSKSVILASIMEDLPYSGNRVRPGEKDHEIVLEYRISDHDQARIKIFRQELARVFKSYRPQLIKQAENNERLAHVCGTCRFGRDPQKTVLDPNNLAHGLSNLYVVDSSFFPSSSGTNPGLTIAANALRVAEYIIRK